MLARRFVFCAKPYAKHIREMLPRAGTVLDFTPFRRFAMSRATLEEMDDDAEDDIMEKTQDKRIIQLSRYVMNNNLKSSLVTYSKLPLFLPRSDFRIVCSLMKQLGTSSGIPDLENVFLKIQRMKLSRKHALTMRCLIRLSYEIGDAQLIETFYRQICEEEIYVNNSFLNDVVFDCLFSLNAYKSICTIVQSLQVGFLVILDCSLCWTKERSSPPSTITPVKTRSLPSWPKAETTCCCSSFSRSRPTGEFRSQSRTTSYPTRFRTPLSPRFSPNASTPSPYFPVSPFSLEIGHVIQRHHRFLRALQRLLFGVQHRAARQSSGRESDFGELSKPLRASVRSLRRVAARSRARSVVLHASLLAGSWWVCGATRRVAGARDDSLRRAGKRCEIFETVESIRKRTVQRGSRSLGGDEGGE